MQKLGRTLALLGSARALLAGAAILAGAAGQAGNKSGGDAANDTALAIPRLSKPGGATPVALPQPLAPSEALRVKRIFALQAKNDIPAAITDCEQLTDTTLLPDILADRYLGGPNRAEPAELISWLARFPDLPDAPAIHALLASQSPKQAARFAAPLPLPPLPTIGSNDNVEPKERLLVRNPALDRSVLDAARSNPDRALRLIARTRGVGCA